jgi:hypothetical protein
MNKSFLFIFLFLLSVSCISAYNVGDSVPLSVHAQYDNGISLVNIPVPCRLSIFFHNTDSFIVRNVSMIPSGAYHTYSFVPAVAGSYTASVLCSYNGDSSVFWFDFDIGSINAPVNNSGGGRGINPDGGSVLQSVFGNASGSIVPEHSVYTVNVRDDSVLTYSTSYFVDSKLANAKVSSWKLLRDGNVLDDGSFTSSATGVYSFSYDFKDLPVGEYQVAESFDGKPLLVDVSVVDRSADLSLISGLVTYDDGSLSVVKLGVLIFVLIIIIVATILLFRSLRKKPVQHSNVPRRDFGNR